MIRRIWVSILATLISLSAHIAVGLAPDLSNSNQEGPGAPPLPVQVPVLLYHHLDPSAAGENGAIISVQEFEQQMTWLYQQGYTGITTRELGRWLAGEATLPAKPVLITFDDGYASGYEYAFPTLQRFGIKATIFVIGESAGQSVGDLQYLSWRQLQEMQKSGLVEVQSHTHNGHRLLDGRPALQVWTVSEMDADLRTLRRGFAQAGLPAPTAFAYPFGAYSETTLSALQGAGVRLAFTVRTGLVNRTDPPLELPRIVIYPGTSPCRFSELLTGRSPGNCRPPLAPSHRDRTAAAAYKTTGQALCYPVTVDRYSLSGPNSTTRPYRP